jgi:hypothetical protein
VVLSKKERAFLFLEKINIKKWQIRIYQESRPDLQSISSYATNMHSRIMEKILKTTNYGQEA